MTTHAKTFTASGFERLMLCPGSAVLAADAPRRASQYSAEGTCIHEASAVVLAASGPWPSVGAQVEADGFTFTWDADMQECGRAYVDYVQGLAGDFILVEQRVAFGPALGIDDPEDGFGTSDAIVGKGDELIVIDLKCGRGVEVTAGETTPGVAVAGVGGDARKPNPQLALYAIGALAELQGLAGDFTSVRLVIVQPRAGGVSEYVLTVAELEQWAQIVARPAADRVLAAALESDEHLAKHLNPTEQGCKFCAAKVTCPALRAEVVSTIAGTALSPATPDEFAEELSDSSTKLTVDSDDGADWISAALSKVDLIEDWCKAVRAEAERRLVAGEPVPGYKLVAGKRGARQWVDAGETEKLFKETFRLKLDEMYDFKLVSPTTAEKRTKPWVDADGTAREPAIGPRQWAKVTALITQGEGKPHVAPESDPRPAITVAATADDFDLA